TVMADETRALSLENVVVHALAVDVVHEDRVAIFVRPNATQVDHRAAMGVATTCITRPAIAGVRRRADVVAMLRDRLNVGVGIGLEMLTRLALVASALDYVVQVRNHARCAKRLAMIVEVDAPGIARPLGEYFKLFPRRVIAPDACIYRSALALRRTRLAHVR